MHVFVPAFLIKPSPGADANQTADSDHPDLKTIRVDVESISSRRGRHQLDTNSTSTQVVLLHGTRLQALI